MKKVIIQLDQWDIESELTFLVDTSIFTEELAEDINNFWSDSDYRRQKAGTDFNAALMLYAVECFRLIEGNNFLDEKYVMAKFERNEKCHGIEGFPTFKQAGLVLESIENWHLEFEHVQIKEVK